VVVTPLALAAALIPAQPLLEGAAWLVEVLLQFLEACALLPGALWQQHTPAAWAVALALGGVAWLLAPRGMPGRACGLALMAPAFLVLPAAPALGSAWITTLDVGQGLAVMVRTAQRTLLYDTGPTFGEDADSGGRIVLPAVRAAGVAAIDLMVLTHEDSDHVGGALSVLEAMPVGAVASSLPPAHAFHTLVHAHAPCAAGRRWEWDGVRFEFLHPAAGARHPRRNNRSCVLRIAARGGAMLLTGDIESPVEAGLQEKALKADVLLVPHHGSRTSSSREFITAVAPRWAVVAAGYRNRFGHPNGEVLARYAAAGVTLMRTDRDGAVHVWLEEAGVRVSTERERRARYWRRTPRV
jgi:competence protein ComEC